MNKRDRQILEGKEPWWYTYWPAAIPLIGIALIIGVIYAQV